MHRVLSGLGAVIVAVFAITAPASAQAQRGVESKVWLIPLYSGAFTYERDVVGPNDRFPYAHFTFTNIGVRRAEVIVRPYLWSGDYQAHDHPQTTGDEQRFGISPGTQNHVSFTPPAEHAVAADFVLVLASAPIIVSAWGWVESTDFETRTNNGSGVGPPTRLKLTRSFAFMPTPSYAIDCAGVEREHFACRQQAVFPGNEGGNVTSHLPGMLTPGHVAPQPPPVTPHANEHAPSP